MRIMAHTLSSAASVTRYNEEKVSRGYEFDGPVASRILTNLQIGDMSARQISNELSPVGKVRAKKKAIHFVVSVHPQDKPNNIQFKAIASRVLQEFGLQRNKFVVYRHFDKDHPHIHIVVNRIDEHGRAAHLPFTKVRCRELSRRLEETYNFVAAEKRRVNERGIRGEYIYDRSVLKAKGQVSSRRYIQAAVLESLKNNPSELVALKRMARRNINVAVRPYLVGKEMKYGMSYAILPGDSRFEMPQEGRASAQDAVASNGVKIADSKGLSIDNTSYFRVRASSLGPAFKFEGYSKAVTENKEVRELITSTRGFNKDVKQDHYIDIRQLIAEESPAVSLLVTAIEQHNEAGINKAISMGAKMNEINKEELSYLPSQIVELAHQVQQNHSQEQVNEMPIFDTGLKLELTEQMTNEKYELETQEKQEAELAFMLERYELLYGKEPSDLTVEFARNIVEGKQEEAYENILENSDWLLRADVRILQLEGVKDYEVSLKLANALDLALDEYAQQMLVDKSLSSTEELEIANNTERFKIALSVGSDYSIGQALEAGKIDFTKIHKVDYAHLYGSEIFNEIESEMLKSVENSPMEDKLKMVIAMEREDLLSQYLLADATLVNTVEPEYFRFVASSETAKVIMDAYLECNLMERVAMELAHEVEFKEALQAGNESLALELVSNEPELLLSIPYQQIASLEFSPEFMERVEGIMDDLHEIKTKLLAEVATSQQVQDRVNSLNSFLPFEIRIQANNEPDSGLDLDNEQSEGLTLRPPSEGE